jgi:hypothetical protein
LNGSGCPYDPDGECASTHAADEFSGVFEITGLLNFDVPDANAFLSDLANVRAVESGIASTLGLDSSWVDVTLTTVRLLRQVEAAWLARRLAGVAASYVISIPNTASSSSATKDTVLNKLTAAANDETSNEFTFFASAIATAVQSATGTSLTVSSFGTPTVTLPQAGTSGTSGTSTGGTGGTSGTITFPAGGTHSYKESDVSAGRSLVVGFGWVLSLFVSFNSM